jgi:hypothetical protein
MTKLITVQKAKEEIQRLQTYVHLVEGYEADTVEKMIIKEHAQTNSIVKVIEILTNRGISIEKQDVLDVIKSKPQDELHRLIRKGYMIRTKHTRKENR